MTGQPCTATCAITCDAIREPHHDIGRWQGVYKAEARTAGHNQKKPVAPGKQMTIQDNTRGNGSEFYEMLFVANPLPMWVFEIASGRFLAVNAQACRHYGYSEEEFLAMTIADIRHPEERAHLA